MKYFTSKLRFGGIIAVTMIVFLLVGIQSALAAYIHMPAAGKMVEKGQEFTVDFLITSPDQAMNAISAVVSFPQDKVRAQAFDKDGSLVDLWTMGPEMNNASGTILFEGVILNPGFAGANGRIFTVRFLALKTGKVPFELTAQTVLANDGLGTDITTDSRRTRVEYTIVDAVPEDDTEPETEVVMTPEEVIETDEEIVAFTAERIDDRRRSGLPQDVVVDRDVSVETGAPEVISFETFAEVEERSARNHRYINILLILVIILLILLGRKYYHYHELRRETYSYRRHK